MLSALGACLAVAVAVLAVGAFGGVIVIEGRTALSGGELGPEGCAFIHRIVAVPFMLAVDQSSNAATRLWKLDAMTNALVGAALPLSIEGVRGNSCFAHDASGYFGAHYGAADNWQVVALDTMTAGATSTIDDLWLGCALEPAAVHAYCARPTIPMNIVKLLRESRVSKEDDVNVAGVNGAGSFVAADQRYFFCDQWVAGRPVPAGAAQPHRDLRHPRARDT
jgi:hypothetical protein